MGFGGGDLLGGVGGWTAARAGRVADPPRATGDHGFVLRDIGGREADDLDGVTVARSRGAAGPYSAASCAPMKPPDWRSQ